MKEAVFEVLARINNIENESARVAALRSIDNGRFKELLQYALTPSVEFNLPTGTPPFTPDNDINSHYAFWGELRRLYVFQKGRTTLDKRRIEQIFIEMLEHLHPEDAKLLVLIKDKEWPYLNITKDIVNLAFPGAIGE